MDKGELNQQTITHVIKQNIVELSKEPAFQWSADEVKYSVNSQGEPNVKVAIGNVPLDYDPWKGLRNPAVIGLHPIGLREIWEYYANKRRSRVDEYGRQSIFQIPRSFEFARRNYSRVLLISIMLPLSHQIIEEYTQLFSERAGSSHEYSRMYEEVNAMIDTVVNRTTIDLINRKRVAMAMTNAMVNDVTTDAIPLTKQGVSHGPSKGGNFPQKSLAVLLGLGQFGVSRIVFRDELNNQQVERFAGPIRSIIVYDDEAIISDGSGGVMYPRDDWRQFVFQLSDFSITDPNVNQHRFCTYIPHNDEGCGKCIQYCPSNALLNSVPSPTGGYSEHVSKQAHRFWNGKLQFDFARCCEERGQMGQLLPEWSCARCVSICEAAGNRRKSAVTSYYEQMPQLTKES